MKARRWGFTGWALAAAAVATAGLGVLAWQLDARARETEDELGKAKKDYEFVVKLRADYRLLEARKQRLPAGSRAIAGGEYAGFLSGKAREAGLPAGNLTPPSAPQSGARWKEYPYYFSVSGKADQPVARSAFVRFLERVEAAVPAFKSKNLSLRFVAGAERQDLQDATVTFSHFEPAAPARR